MRVYIYLAHVTNDVSCAMEMRTGKGLTIEIQISLWIFMVKRIEITAISRRNISRSRRLKGGGERWGNYKRKLYCSETQNNNVL